MPGRDDEALLHLAPCTLPVTMRPFRKTLQNGEMPTAQGVATKLPDLPPCFSSNFTSVIIIPRSTALHMS